jgi:hypothetical protein
MFPAVIGLLGGILSIRAAEPERMLTEESVYVLVMNTPSAIALEARKGCADVDIVDWSRSTYAVQLRNLCPTGQTGLAGVFYIDRDTGMVWTDPERKKSVDSDRLRRLRRLLLGEVPSVVNTKRPNASNRSR